MASSEEKASEASEGFSDPTSSANVHQILVQNTELSFDVDFAEKVLRGTALLTFRVVSSEAVSEIVLDTNKLDIQSVSEVKSDPEPVDEGLSALMFRLEKGSIDAFGHALRIHLPTDRKLGEVVTVRISFVTSPKADAIQWLEPSQTKGGKLPYLFTQCQAILARSMFPCQDTPGAKSPYTASVTVKKPFVALMSALSDGSEETDDSITYRFKQPVPTSSYLYALVVGDLESREISDRCRVWAEPSEVEKAAWEFAETEDYLKIAEELCGPYQWTRYDLLMLPPSFPYGGMENVNLTFVTPTLIAGDRSLANVVAHEIAHSWSGNLVSPSTWEDFWLNEGWTRFIEARIMGRKHGREHELLGVCNGITALRDSVTRFGEDSPLTALHCVMKDVDPDDSFSSVPYEKGCNFLRFLEQTVGGPKVFERFAKDYFEHFKFKCLDSKQFENYFLDWCKNSSELSDEVKAKAAAVDFEKWLTETGMPELVAAESKLITAANALWEKWAAFESGAVAERSADDLKDFCTEQTEMMLDTALRFVEDKLATLRDDAAAVDVFKQKVRDNLVNGLKEAYGFDESKNCELLFRFCKLALVCDAHAFVPLATGMLDTVGRMKFVRPLFRFLVKNEARRKVANETFARNKDKYHPICSKMVARDLGIDA